MTDIWRNMMRRKVRTGLTVMGIVIGIMALTVMGSLAERMNRMVDGAMSYYGTRVIVQDAQSPDVLTTRPLSFALLSQIEALEGVERALPTIYMFLGERASYVFFATPALIMGLHPEWSRYEEEPLVLSQGRHLQPQDRGVVVIGVAIAQKFKVAEGKEMLIRGRRFQVVGVLDRTMTAPDGMVLMPLADAQELYVANLPPVLRPQTAELASVIEVFPQADASFDEVAQRINQSLPGVRAISPREFQEDVSLTLVIFNALMLGGAIIALVVGGLAIINTMVMSVSERTREIGVKKAVGASTGQILREHLAEAGGIGLLGGLLGLGLGTILAISLNGLSQSQGVSLFTVTPRLALAAIAFATFLGVAAGLYPAFRAARLDPVAALRSE